MLLVVRNLKPIVATPFLASLETRPVSRLETRHSLRSKLKQILATSSKNELGGVVHAVLRGVQNDHE